MAKLFGFEINRASDANQDTPSFVPPTNDDGAVQISEGGVFGQYIDLEGTAKNETDLINRYRDMAGTPECETAIDDIVNEAIVSDLYESPVQIELSNVEASEKVKNIIRDE